MADRPYAATDLGTPLTTPSNWRETERLVLWPGRSWQLRSACVMDSHDASLETTVAVSWSAINDAQPHIEPQQCET